MRVIKTITCIHLTCLILVTYKSTFAQTNLVPNPSFEYSLACPSGGGMLSVASWSAFQNSPDYFNSCSSATACGTPNNAFGHQQPASGNSYCGFLSFWAANGSREYLGAKLVQPLTIGQRYFLSMKVSLAERWWYFDDTLPLYIPSNKVGMKFTGTQYSLSSPLFPNNQSALFAVNIISDTTNWVTLNGVFVADSAYKYVVLGNFFTNANTDTIGRPFNVDSYFFVDDVIVTTDSTMILAGINENEVRSVNKVVVSVRVSSIHISSNTDVPKELYIYDAKGILLRREEFTEVDKYFDLSLKSGMYYVLVKSTDSILVKKKIQIDAGY